MADVGPGPVFALTAAAPFVVCTRFPIIPDRPGTAALFTDRIYFDYSILYVV